MIFISFGFAAMRFGIRALLLSALTISTRVFALEISGHYDKVIQRTKDCISNISDRLEASDLPWEDSVRIWVKAALWNAKRAEYLDRYSTTVSWKVRLFMKRLEHITFAIKVLILAAASYWVFVTLSSTTSGSSAVMVASLTLGIAGASLLLGWGYWLNWKDDFLIKVFLDKAKMSYDPDTHYYNDIASCLANMVFTAQKNERGKK